MAREGLSASSLVLGGEDESFRPISHFSVCFGVLLNYTLDFRRIRPNTGLWISVANLDPDPLTKEDITRYGGGYFNFVTCG